MTDSVSDKIGSVIDSLFAKKDYKFIKDTDHSDFPGPGYHRTKTGWSNRDESTSVGENHKKNNSGSSKSKSSDNEKEKPVIKQLDEIEEDTVIIEGLANGNYFNVFANLSVDAIDEITKATIEENINNSISKNSIATKFPLSRKDYIKIIEGLTKFDIKKISLK